MNIGKSNLTAALINEALRRRPPFGDGYDAVREDRAIAKRERIARRNRWTRIGAPVWPAERIEQLREDRWIARAKNHGHEAGDPCDACVEIGNRMIQRGTA